MKRVSLFLTESEIKGLQKASKKTGLKMAEIIRRLIDDYLKRGSEK